MKKVLLVASMLCAGYGLFAQEAVTADQALQRLKDGNARYVSDTRTYPNQKQEARTLNATKGQHPWATVLSCADSRVPVEHIFDAGIGDLFIIRVAGNVADTDETGTIEYGAEHLKSPLVVVLGHTKCGAVTAVCKGDHVTPNIAKLVDNVVPAVEKAKKEKGTTVNDDVINQAIKNNVFQAIEDMVKNSETMTELASKGEVKIVGAIYNIETGAIEWLGEHPNMKQLLEKGAHKEKKDEHSGHKH